MIGVIQKVSKQVLGFEPKAVGLHATSDGEYFREREYRPFIGVLARGRIGLMEPMNSLRLKTWSTWQRPKPSWRWNF